MKYYDHIEEKLCSELDKLDRKYAGDTEMSTQDLEMLRLLLSSAVKLDTHYAMKEEAEMNKADMEASGRRGTDGRMYSGRGNGMRGEEDGQSYRRARDSMGRFISRDMMPMSGTYPEWMPPYYGGRF